MNRFIFLALMLSMLLISLLPFSVKADTINGPADTEWYYFDGSKGLLDLTNRKSWALTVANIDPSGIAGNKAFQFFLNDAGAGWENIGIQVHTDFYGSGGHLLQLYDCLPQTGWAWIVRKSHGFNLGDVPGTFDLRMLVQDLGNNYEVTPQFRLPASNWTTFYEGSYQTVDFELTNSRLGMQIDAGASGTVTFDPPSAVGGKIRGYWKLDEGTGTTTYDSSGNLNHGTIYGGASWTEGKISKALEFDGTDDYVEAPDSDSLDITGKITLEAWIYPHTMTHLQIIVAKYNHSGGNGAYYLGLGGYGYMNKILFALSNDGVHFYYMLSNTNITVNTWTHVAGTSNSTHMILYINGNKDSVRAYSPGVIHASDAPLRIGCYLPELGYPRFFDGVIDEVAVSATTIWTVDDDRVQCPTADFTSIQPAINTAGSEDTILVYDGTYNEALYINKSLTIRAASKPIVKGSQLFSTDYGSREAVIFVEDAYNVILEGLDVEGEGLGPGPTKSYGILYQNSIGAVAECIISPNMIGDMYNVGIAGISRSDLLIENCTVENFGRIGIYATNVEKTRIVDNEIIGQVYTEDNLVSYGIEIEDYDGASTAEMIGNDIYNCDNTHPNPLWSSAAIIIDIWRAYYDLPLSTVSIEMNEIHDNYEAIEVVSGNLSYAHYNNIYDNRYGIWNWPDLYGNNGTFDARFNWWGHETGPYHNSSWTYMGSPYGPNYGSGDNVGDYVLYHPWLESQWPVPDPTLSIEPPLKQTQAINKTFNINVTINDLSIIHWAVGLMFRVCYNETLLEVVNVVQGPFFDDPAWNLNGKWSIFIVEDDIIYGPNVLVGMMLYPNNTGYWNAWPTGSGVIATITFNIIRQEKGLEKPPLTCGLTLNDTQIIDDEIELVSHSLQHGTYENYPDNIADINWDGIVDMRDVGIAARAFGSEPGHERWNPDCDITGPTGQPDGKIDMRDIAIVARNFGWTPTYDP